MFRPDETEFLSPHLIAMLLRKEDDMQTPQLFALLPDYVCTPDGMAIAPNGDLVLSCPNFADRTKPGCLVRIDKNKNIRKWVDIPPLSETGLAFPMGIAFGPDGDLYVVDNQGWPGDANLQFKGRILRLKISETRVEKTTVVACGMEHPNGLRIHTGHIYVTQSLMVKVKDRSGLMVSGVYRFRCTDSTIAVNNTLEDKNLLTTLITRNPECQYGADGIEFDKAGNLYVGNFGDGAVHKITFNADGSVKGNRVWAHDAAQLQTTDGMIRDEKGNVYIADFSANAMALVTPDARVRRIAQSPDTDGFHGELDQPSEPIIWNGKLVVACFDLVTGPGKVNTKHEMPATMSQLQLEA